MTLRDWARDRAEQIYLKCADQKDSYLLEIQKALLEAADKSREEDMEVIYKNLREHDQFSGEYDAGAVNACKNIAFEINSLKSKDGGKE